VEAITLADALARQRAAGDPWVELLRVPDLSAGLYVLPAGGVDRQQPHTEDEVYVVVAGRSRFTSGSATREVGPGDLLFVPAHEPHRFHDILDELHVIVVFGPAEGSRAG
jgi:mannose-6-phosphate isomerase-like protein (cupin superfamily)